MILLGAALAAGPAPDFTEAARAAHATLGRICDDHGGRLVGTAGNEGAIAQLEAELRALGLETERESFTFPGWQRGADRVELIAPLARPLRVAALAYANPHPEFEAEVVDVDRGRPEDYRDEARGRVVLLSPSTPLQTREAAQVAAAHGARAILFINREGGGQLLARSGSFIGEPLAVPVYSIAQEEGRWLQRLCARGVPVRVRLETRSRDRELTVDNLRVRLPGRSPERVVVGAHVDSWDLGQGALDNGLGVAQALALAQALRGRDLARTVELVWFNAEELGLWGSRHAAGQLGDAPIVAMINLDMVGVPIAVNALGDDSLVPLLERWNAGRATPLPRGVENINWFGSDHTPYQLAGVRAVTFNAPIPREAVRYYHDLADTFDKVPESLVVESTAVIGDLVWHLVHDPAAGARRRPPAETERLFTRFGLDRRMRAVGWWPFAPSQTSP